MMLLPVQLHGDDEFTLFVLLEDENIDRIKEHDPAEVTVQKLGGKWADLKVRDICITYLAPGEAQKFMDLCKVNRVQEALRKWPLLKEKHPGIRLHLIGPLQTNKVRDAIAFHRESTVLQRFVERQHVARDLRADRAYVIASLDTEVCAEQIG